MPIVISVVIVQVKRDHAVAHRSKRRRHPVGVQVCMATVEADSQERGTEVLEFLPQRSAKIT